MGRNRDAVALMGANIPNGRVRPLELAAGREKALKGRDLRVFSVDSARAYMHVPPIMDMGYSAKLFAADGWWAQIVRVS